MRADARRGYVLLAAARPGARASERRLAARIAAIIHDPPAARPPEKDRLSRIRDFPAAAFPRATALTFLRGCMRFSPLSVAPEGLTTREMPSLPRARPKFAAITQDICRQIDAYLAANLKKLAAKRLPALVGRRACTEGIDCLNRRG